jgi:hypothetical protein
MSSQMATAFVAAKANQTRLVEESAALWGGATAAPAKAAAPDDRAVGVTATEVDKAGTVIKGGHRATSPASAPLRAPRPRAACPR